MMKQFGFFLMFCWLAFPAKAQLTRQDTLPRQGAWATLEIVNGDSTFLMSLAPGRIVAKRQYKDLEEQKQFRRYVWAAKRVYPYALQAVALYEDMEEETEGMNRRQRKRHIRHEHKELKEDMTERMKNLSKTEGKVLVKMIERELNMPFYEVIRTTRGTATAAYWNTMGKIWGYDLKEGYRQGADPLLDEVFIDYDFGNPLR
ncbi:MAG TPA: DUF4294 domain-containing protein [Saprospiraceae bacterium]|nr:DUF4294 domain-containing protein [Saprospiraceae bacterium]